MTIESMVFNQKFYILPHVYHHFILGVDFLSKKKKIDYENNTVYFPNQNISTIYKPLPIRPGKAILMENVEIEPNSEMIVPVRVSHATSNYIALIEPVSTIIAKSHVMVAKCVSRVINNSSICRILNPSNNKVEIPAGKVMGNCTPIQDKNISILEDESSPSVSVADLQTNNAFDQNAIQMAKDLGIDLSNTNLSPEQKHRLLTLIGKNRKVFSANNSELGQTNLFSHRIETGSAKPHRQQPNRCSSTIRKEIKNKTKELLKDDLIQPSNSMWQSPVVLVKKKSGEYRFAIDYRHLNKVTEPISFPLPRLECIFDMLGESQPKYFSTLDLASGFWQIPMDPETGHKSAFTTYEGSFEWKVMPFGFINAPATYQMVMNQVLRGLNWKILLVYMDDIVIFSNTFEEHLSHLDIVFSRLRDANLTLQPAKCNFAAPTVAYLGHYLTPNGIEVDPSEVDAVRTFPTPKTVKDVRSFIGLCSFYRRFVKDFSQKATPLNKLLRKDTPFEWLVECENAFQSLKSSLIKAPHLRFPNLNSDFILTTDASVTALSYILSQKDENGVEIPIVFGGRATRGAEQRYTISELEFLAVVEGVKAYHPYLAHSHFTVKADHMALKWLENVQPSSTPRLARWALHLQQYRKTIIHKPGKKNKAADALSRRPYPATPESESDDVAVEQTVLTTNAPKTKCLWVQTTFSYAHLGINNRTLQGATPTIDALSPQDLKSAQKTCDDFKNIYEYVEEGELPNNARLAKRIVAEADQYIIDDEGILYHIYTPRTKGVTKAGRLITQLAVPRINREENL